MGPQGTYDYKGKEGTAVPREDYRLVFTRPLNKKRSYLYQVKEAGSPTEIGR